MTEAETEMLVQLSAQRIAHRSTVAALLLALAEAKALDLDRALSFVDTLASAFRQPVEAAIVRMTTMPAGAGTA